MPCAFAQRSTANTPRRSVAVVITAVACSFAAISSASAFAPPRCPERIGITNRPVSSATSTAGSVALLFTCGAIARTAMPAAPTKRSASESANRAAVQSASDTFPPMRVTFLPMRFESASPRSVKAAIASLTLQPPNS